MAILETKRQWDFTSTGTGKFHPVGPAESLTFGIRTSSGCTASVQIVHRMGSTSAPGNGTDFVLSTVQCTVADAQTDQFLGPLEWVAPRVKDKTAGGTTNTVTVYLDGVG